MNEQCLSVIYALVDPRDQEIRYVGKTREPAVRLRTHIWRAKSGKIGHRESWIRSLLESEMLPDFAVIDFCSDEDVKDVERHWVEFGRKAQWNLTNKTSGGEGVVKHSQDTRKNLSRSLKGRTFTEEHKEKLREARGNGNWSLSDEARQRLSERNKANPLTGEALERLTKSRLGKKNSPEHNAKISKAKTGISLSRKNTNERLAKLEKD